MSNSIFQNPCQSLANPAPIVSMLDGKLVTSSISVAACFEKQHKNVMRDVENLLAYCSNNFTELNFELNEYTDPTGRKLPMYNLTFDGFIMLAMGYTGPKAIAIKEAYIAAFNAMREKLANPQVEGRDNRRESEFVTPEIQTIEQLRALYKKQFEGLCKMECKTLYDRIGQRIFRRFGSKHLDRIAPKDYAEAARLIMEPVNVPFPKEPKALSSKSARKILAAIDYNQNFEPNPNQKEAIKSYELIRNLAEECMYAGSVKFKMIWLNSCIPNKHERTTRMPEMRLC